MAALTEQDRVDLWAQWQRTNADQCGILKAELRAAVDAADDWVDANSAAFNAALPQPARGTLTTSQKARLLTLIVERRFNVGL